MLAALLLGLLAWTFIEYASHRFGGHDLRAGGHPDHHADPIEHLFLRPVPVLAAAIPIGAGFYWMGGMRGVMAWVGLMMGLLAYELIHGAIHLRPDLMPAWLVTRHLAHHDRPISRFGVTSPLWDWVFGTNN